MLRRKKAARLVKSRMEENGRTRAQYCEQSTFDWRRYSHWKLEVEKARLAAFLLCGGVRTRPMLVKPVLLPPRCRPRPSRAHHRQGEKGRFAEDSPLEGDGFEPSVPP